MNFGSRITMLLGAVAVATLLWPAGALAEILEAGAAEEHYSEEFHVQSAVLSALRVAAMRDPEVPGTPHDGSFEALVRVYETLAARVLADGGTDPFEETYRDDGNTASSNYNFLVRVLRSSQSTAYAPPPRAGTTCWHCSRPLSLRSCTRTTITCLWYGVWRGICCAAPAGSGGCRVGGWRSCQRWVTLRG